MSPIDVCNQALAHLGDRRITRLDDDAQLSDALVRYCAEYYRQARQEVLAAQRWTFAKHSVWLSRRTDTTPFGFNYVHQMPEDSIRLLRLMDSQYQIDRFKIVGQQVWTDFEKVAIEYIRDVDNPDDWTPHFRAAVARLLASYLAGPVADDPNEVTNQKRIYETIDLPNAQFYDAVQDNSGENSEHQTRLANSGSLRSRYHIGYGEGGVPSTPTTPETPVTPPTAPTNLAAIAYDSQVDLTWDAVTEANSYTIFVDGVELASALGTSASVTGLTNGQTYSFTVRAVNAGGSSGDSNTVTATPVEGASASTLTFGGNNLTYGGDHLVFTLQP